MKELLIEIKWKFILESSFTSHWLSRLRSKWFYCDKISDGSIWNKKVDCYIITNKWFYACEIKIITNDIFPLSRLRSNQWASLRKADENLPWCAIVCVYSKNINKYKIIPFSIIDSINKNDSIKLDFNKE